MTDFAHEPQFHGSREHVPHSYLEHGDILVSEDGMPIKLFVGSLPYDVEENDLISIFDKFGEISEFSILRDRFGKSRGCAALCFTTEEAAETCIKTLHNRFCCGSVPTPLQVKYFEKREHAPVMCYIQGLPYAFAPHSLWSSFGARYGPVSNVTLDPSGYAAYVSFYKKSSAFAFCNDSQSAGIYVDGMLCPSAQVTMLKFPTMMAPMMPSPIYSPFSYGPDFTLPPPAPLEGEDPSMKLFVGCLPYSKTAQDIADLFSTFGSLVEVAILTDYNGKSRGAAFVTFTKTSEANNAVRELSGYCFPKSTRPINISFAYKQSIGDHVTCESPDTPVCQENVTAH